jgi:regulator of protease activity HflC (stomatin/prohibitin superfamily)
MFGLFKTIRIKSHERGLWFCHGEFRKLVDRGTYRIPCWAVARDSIEVASTLTTRFDHKLLDVLLGHEDVRSSLLVVDNNDTERALLWRDDRLAYILGPGRHAFWNFPFRLTVEQFSLGAFRFDHARLSVILQHPDALRWLDCVAVEADTEALLYRDGILVDRLGPGLHVFWKGTGKTRFLTVDRREQVADVAGQEIITADKVSLRVNLLVTWKVQDAVRAVSASGDHAQALYRAAQLALRASVGARTLDALLADKESVGAEILAALTSRAGELGLAVKGVGVRDLILPGDMKALLNGVIAAQKEAEANLIRRREETASVRSQANTAKLLAESPPLQRLKELEALKEVLAGAKTTFVFGSGDIAEQVRGLVNADKE